MIAPSIQRDLINSCSKETTKVIMKELGEDYFGILVDESSDVSQTPPPLRVERPHSTFLKSFS